MIRNTCNRSLWAHGIIFAYSLILFSLQTDVRAPTFLHCPSSFTIGLPPSSSTVVVRWAVPSATSRGQVVPVVHSEGLTPPATLQAGSHVMEYVARDGSLESYCRFTINVKGNFKTSLYISKGIGRYQSKYEKR